MPHQPVGRNAKCPCGSGKKYKQCCLKKDYEFQEDDQGNIRRVIPMSDEVGTELQEHMTSLSHELGRDLDPDDALFPIGPFEHTEHHLVEGMKAAGIDPAIIHAFEETGLLVSEENQDLISDEDLADWHAAIDDYRANQNRSGVEYPVGTVAMYGPDQTVTTKIVVGVILSADSEPILERFVGRDVANDPKVQETIQQLFRRHKVTKVAATNRNIGCPHEEGEDFPVGEDCPFCPAWQGRQGSAAALADDEQASGDEEAIAMQVLESMDPSILGEMMQLAQQCDDADEFANLILVGPCPRCDSQNTCDCDEDPEIDDPSIGRCGDCGQLWCCFCEEPFRTVDEAVGHECLAADETMEDMDEPF